MCRSTTRSICLMILGAFAVVGLIAGCDNPTDVPPEQITVSLSPAGGVYPELQLVTITAEPSDATIMYTLDGSEPTRSHGYEYSGSFYRTSDGSVHAFAFKDGWTDSDVVVEEYTILWWVAGSADGAVYFSYEDGATDWWHQNLSGIDGLWGLQTDGLNDWVAYYVTPPSTVSTTVYSSTDRAATFTTTTLDPNVGMIDLASDRAGTWVAPCFLYGATGSSYFIEYSDDAGQTWNDPTWEDSNYPANLSSLTAVASDLTDTWVAVGQGATAVYTTGWADGPWKVGSGLSGNLFDVATNTMGDWCAVGATTGLSSAIVGLAYYSTDDGATWNASTLPAGVPQLWSVAALRGANAFVAVGGAATDVPVVLYSTDGGESFSEATHPLLSTSDDLNDVSCNGYGTWVAVGGNRTMISSTNNGVTWSRCSIGPGSTGGDSADFLTSISFGRWEH